MVLDNLEDFDWELEAFIDNLLEKKEFKDKELRYYQSSLKNVFLPADEFHEKISPCYQLNNEDNPITRYYLALALIYHAFRSQFSENKKPDKQYAECARKIFQSISFDVGLINDDSRFIDVNYQVFLDLSSNIVEFSHARAITRGDTVNPFSIIWDMVFIDAAFYERESLNKKIIQYSDSSLPQTSLSNDFLIKFQLNYLTAFNQNPTKELCSSICQAANSFNYSNKALFYQIMADEIYYFKNANAPYMLPSKRMAVSTEHILSRLFFSLNDYVKMKRLKSDFDNAGNEFLTIQEVSDCLEFLEKRKVTIVGLTTEIWQK